MHDTEHQSESIDFETGNPQTASIIKGTVHVTHHKPVTSFLLTVTSVPALMTSADFCKFVLPFVDTITHMRTLRPTTERNRYMVIIKFRSLDAADTFAQQYHNKQFLRGISQETCAISVVQSIQFDSSHASTREIAHSDNHVNPNNKLSDLHRGDSQTALFPCTAMFPEEGQDNNLQPSPNCAICLERLDSANSALVTNFCNHTLHATCLAKCDANCCPVCRHALELTPESTVCMKCGQRDGLWMCIVCAFVGCGYYHKKHALEHFRETQHPFASNLTESTFWSGDTLRAGVVWDYISERFVNRLISSDDGKVVEVDGQADSGLNGGASSANVPRDSCCSGAQASIIIEDDQNDRAYQAAIYASRMDATVEEYRARIDSLENEKNAEKMRYEAEICKLKSVIDAGSKERKGLSKRLSEMGKELQTLRDKNGFLKNLNEMLLRDKQAWNDEVEKLRIEADSLRDDGKVYEEQLRDLMLHLETQSKITADSSAKTGKETCRSGAAELQGADIVRVGPSRRERLAMKTNRRSSGG